MDYKKHDLNRLNGEQLELAASYSRWVLRYFAISMILFIVGIIEMLNNEMGYGLLTILLSNISFAMFYYLARKLYGVFDETN